MYGGRQRHKTNRKGFESGYLLSPTVGVPRQVLEGSFGRDNQCT